ESRLILLPCSFVAGVIELLDPVSNQICSVQANVRSLPQKRSKLSIIAVVSTIFVDHVGDLMNSVRLQVSLGSFSNMWNISNWLGKSFFRPEN
ncbi:hypothetical protein PFISCL1PPCAC_11174, partial [Pristionchus fissidentatus]